MRTQLYCCVITERRWNRKEVWRGSPYNELSGLPAVLKKLLKITDLSCHKLKTVTAEGWPKMMLELNVSKNHGISGSSNVSWNWWLAAEVTVCANDLSLFTSSVTRPVLCHLNDVWLFTATDSSQYGWQWCHKKTKLCYHRRHTTCQCMSQNFANCCITL